MSAGQDHPITIKPGGVERIKANGESFLFCKFSDRDIRVNIGGREVVMRGGSYQEFEPLSGEQSNIVLFNPDEDNPAAVVFVTGTGTYDEKIVRGEVTVTPGLRKADGSFKPDTRFDIELFAEVTDDTVTTYSENQNVVTKASGDVAFDLNKSIFVADEQYAYHLKGDSVSDNFYVLDPFTLEVVASADVDFIADGIAAVRQGVIKGGRLYACVIGKGYNWQGPAGDAYEWWGIVSWPISTGGLGSITVHVDDYPRFGTIVNSVIWNRERGTWLVQRDDEIREVSTLSKSAVDAAKAVMTEVTPTYGDSWVLYAPDYEEIFIRGQYFDSNTLEHKGARTLTNDSQDQAYGYSATTGLYYTKDSPNVIANSYESGNKWAGAVHVSAGCDGIRGKRKKGTVLRLPLSYESGDYGATMTGPVIQAALTAYKGEAPPADYMDHIYRLTISDGITPVRTINTGSETFDRANVADQFTVATPVELTLTIDNELYNGA